MGSDLARLKHQLPSLPKDMREELAWQIQEMEFRHQLAMKASNQQTDRVRHTNTEISRLLDGVGETLQTYQALSPTQQRELSSQVDQVLANSRSLLQATHQEALAQIRTASPPKPKRSSFLDEFADEVIGLFKTGE